jgi:NAD(P)-dependent dehydrogenase (short-subunit alcohol dehydrogenase family)
MAKVAVVTGSSSSIGYETSILLARNQFATYATMRNLNKGERADCLPSYMDSIFSITQQNSADADSGRRFRILQLS